MPTTEVPLNEWSLFFDSFSLRHEGWLVNLEVRDLADSPLKMKLGLYHSKVFLLMRKMARTSSQSVLGEDGATRLRQLKFKSPTSVRLNPDR